jgi:putative NADH-flavin reductase
MNIVLIGASGFIGSALTREALARGHKVTALVGHPEKLPAQPNLSAVAADVMDVNKLTAQLAGADAVISAFSGHAQSDILAYYVKGIGSIVAATREARVPRLLVVGGAGSLEVAPGVLLIDSPDFPPQYKASAQGAQQALNLLRGDTALNWTMLSPPAIIAPGQRTGVFRSGLDQLIARDDGSSTISVEDYAVAMIDELEKPVHLRRRFTVGY